MTARCEPPPEHRGVSDYKPAPGWLRRDIECASRRVAQWETRHEPRLIWPAPTTDNKTQRPPLLPFALDNIVYVWIAPCPMPKETDDGDA